MNINIFIKLYIMDKIDKVFYINLTRRSDRNENFIRSCLVDAQIPIDKIERFDALDGKTYVPTEKETQMFSKCDYLHETFYNNIVCNQLGHYYILKEIIKNKYNYAIVCQDDVYFRKDFQSYIKGLIDNLPDDAEMVNIGLHAFALYQNFIPWDLSRSADGDCVEICETKINEYICKLKKEINPCSLAYIVTLQGAINLVEYFDNNGFHRATDWNFNDYLSYKDIFYCSLPVLCSGNPMLSSDIFI
jgi:GR25 family glycosyltransferase involved in LPS biosynthesis